MELKILHFYPDLMSLYGSYTVYGKGRSDCLEQDIRETKP